MFFFHFQQYFYCLYVSNKLVTFGFVLFSYEQARAIVVLEKNPWSVSDSVCDSDQAHIYSVYL